MKAPGTLQECSSAAPAIGVKDSYLALIGVGDSHRSGLLGQQIP